MSILLIGEAPGREGDSLPGRSAFDPATRSGRKLADLAGVADVRDVFGAVNLVDRWPGRTSHGSAFPTGRARETAERLMDQAPPRTDFIIVGKRTASAFGIDRDVDYLKWFWHGDPYRHVAVFPHPSGVSRWWNDRGNEARARRFLRAAMKRERA